MLSNADPAKILMPYIHRAHELQNYEPLVAYYCKIYAMNRLLKLPKKERTKLSDELVDLLMKQQEKDKKSLQLSSDDGPYVEGFAMKLFMRADKQERCGKANLNTAKTFYAASLFFETLHTFGDFPFDIEQKQRYAAWRAAEIRKALKKGRKPVAGAPSSDKAFPVSDGRVVSSESLSVRVAADLKQQSFSVEQSAATRVEINVDHDQVPFSSTKSRESLSDPRFKLDIQSGGNISTSDNYQQDSSDDDESFHSCSEEPDDDVLFPDDTCSGPDQTIHAPTHVQGQVYHTSAAEIAENGVHFSNIPIRSFERTFSSTADVQGRHDRPSAAKTTDRRSLERTFSMPADGQGRHDQPSAAETADRDSSTGLNCPTSAPPDVHGKFYEPSAAEVVKALKASRFAVSALASHNIPSAVSYIKHALDLLTNPPQNSIIS